MAFQMSYESRDGTVHEASYWRPISINLNVAAKTADVMFAGYKDLAARTAGKAPVGRKSYFVKPDAYPIYFSTAVLDVQDPMASSYLLALDTLEPNAASFFDGATNV